MKKKSYDNPPIVCMNGNVWELLHVEDVYTLMQTGPTHRSAILSTENVPREHVVCRPEKGKITWSGDRKQ